MAQIFNPVTATEPDNYGILESTFSSAGLYPCRVIPWPGKDVEYEFDRDTRRSLIRMIIHESAAGVVQGTSRIQLSSQTQMGQIYGSTQIGQEFTDTMYEVQGDPQVFHRRTGISHVELVIRALEG
jgi:hypothetical protein